MNKIRELANRAWRTGRYRAGIALDRAADLLDEAEKYREQAQAHRIAATAHLDQAQAHVRDLADRLQDGPMTALTARNVDLTGQILAFLDGQSPLPVSTPVIYAACWGRHVDYTAVYRTLNRLARAGEVEKWSPCDDRRACLWRRLTVPVQPEPPLERTGDTP